MILKGLIIVFEHTIKYHLPSHWVQFYDILEYIGRLTGDDFMFEMFIENRIIQERVNANKVGDKRASGSRYIDQ